jgi:hypothetical protein
MTAPQRPSDTPGKWDTTLTPPMIAQFHQVGAPRWLGEGTIAYIQNFNKRADIAVADATGGLPLIITADREPIPATTGGFGSGYTIAPDGGTIVYTSADDGKLYTIAATGGKARRLRRGARGGDGHRDRWERW